MAADPRIRVNLIRLEFASIQLLCRSENVTPADGVGHTDNVPGHGTRWDSGDERQSEMNQLTPSVLWLNDLRLYTYYLPGDLFLLPFYNTILMPLAYRFIRYL